MIIDLPFFFQITLQCFVICIIVVAVRLVFPSEKITVRLVIRALLTSLFVAIMIAYYAHQHEWTQSRTVISIMLGAFLADDVLNVLIKNGILKFVQRVKQNAGSKK